MEPTGQSENCELRADILRVIYSLMRCLRCGAGSEWILKDKPMRKVKLATKKTKKKAKVNNEST